MHHAHIGWNSWEETAKGFRYIYEELKKRDVVLDRFGVALDWVMGVPEQYRDKVMKGGSLIFETPEEWAAVGQVVPIQPHFGDHMIGSLNSTENVKLALNAGVTCMGNIAQYYTYEYPGSSYFQKTGSSICAQPSVLWASSGTKGEPLSIPIWMMVLAPCSMIWLI